MPDHKPTTFKDESLFSEYPPSSIAFRDRSGVTLSLAFAAPVLIIASYVTPVFTQKHYAFEFWFIKLGESKQWASIANVVLNEAGQIGPVGFAWIALCGLTSLAIASTPLITYLSPSHELRAEDLALMNPDTETLTPHHIWMHVVQLLPFLIAGLTREFGSVGQCIIITAAATWMAAASRVFEAHSRSASPLQIGAHETKLLTSD